MSRKSIALLAAVLTLAANGAHAADVSLAQVNGEVLVQGGGRLTAAKAGTVLKAGDRIVAKSGRATVTYADGCKATVTENAMLTVAKASPCAGAGGLVSAGGAAAQLGGLPNWPVGAYFAGAGVVVIVGAIAYGLTDPTKETPISN